VVATDDKFLVFFVQSGLHVIGSTFVIITGSIARSATRRYFSYSDADFEVFRTAWATSCTDGDEIWHGGGDRRLIRVQDPQN